jgi:hypothetical protein
LALRGLIGSELRLPLVPMESPKVEHLRNLMASLNLI